MAERTNQATNQATTSGELNTAAGRGVPSALASAGVAAPQAVNIGAGSAASAGAAPSFARHQRLAAVYDAEVWPLGPLQAAKLILQAFPAGARTVFELGCATGGCTVALAETVGPEGHVLAVDAIAPLIEAARRQADVQNVAERVTWKVTPQIGALPEAVGNLVRDPVDVAVSNLTLGELPDPAAVLAALASRTRPGGRVLVTLRLRGSWGELLDLYRDVLIAENKAVALSALAAYEATLPEGDTAAGWMERAGLTDVKVDVARVELLFRSAREFFFSPAIEFGPLPHWKRIAGGRGDEMQDTFFFVKEAIDTYFAGSVFPVTLVLGCVTATRPG